MNTIERRAISRLTHRFNRLSLRRKLVLIITSVSLTIVILAMAATFLIEASFFRRKLLEDHQTSARMIAANIRASMIFEDETDATDILGSLGERDAVLKAAAYLENGYLLATYFRPDTTSSAKPPPANPATGIQDSSINITQDVIHDGERIGTVVIVADLGELDAFIVTRSWLILGLFGLSAVLSFYLATYLGRLIAKPILELAKTADRISKEKDYSIRQKRLSDDETGKLVDAFNNMLGEIENREDELLAAMKKAESSSKAKDDFLSVISHELRTPLNPIIGYVDVLQNKRFNSEEKTQLMLVKQYAEHLQGLIDDIIDYSRIERGVFSIDSKPVDYKSVCDDVCELLREEAEKKGLQVTAEHEPAKELAEGDFIRTDRVRLQQILLNLVSNGIKFTEEGSIKIKSSLSQGDHCLELRIEVSDTGVGIAEGNEETVFEPFRQLEDSLTREHDGMGLGLAITRKIVTAMDGSIGFSSAPRQGSCFWFTLPTEISTKPAEAPRSSPKSASGSKRVLLVDDQLVNLELGRSLLSERGLEVICARSGREAIKKFEESSFDLVIMDIKMPRLSGFDTTKKIREIERRRNTRTPIIAMTAHVTANGAEVYEEAGMDDMLAKPFSIDKLDTILARWLT